VATDDQANERAHGKNLKVFHGLPMQPLSPKATIHFPIPLTSRVGGTARGPRANTQILYEDEEDVTQQPHRSEFSKMIESRYRIAQQKAVADQMPHELRNKFKDLQER